MTENHVDRLLRFGNLRDAERAAAADVVPDRLNGDFEGVANDEGERIPGTHGNPDLLDLFENLRCRAAS